MRLLSKDKLLVTGPVDKAAWNYSLALSWLQRARFRLALDLLGPAPVDTLLEVGYGSGIFMPELKTRCHELVGVDVHTRADEVAAQLRSEGVPARLFVSSAESLPLPSASVDAIVTISCLEYVPDKTAASRELARVLRPGGRLIVIHPQANPLLDLALRILTGEAASQYGDGREKLGARLAADFHCLRTAYFPPLVPRSVAVYEGLLLGRRIDCR